MATNKPALLVYNSNLKPDDEILAEFVVRQDIYEELFEAIQSATMHTPEQHYLIVGQRGMGKTTLINRLRLGIEQDPKLNTWLMPVVLQEEQYQITELANLWEVVADYLEGLDGVAFAGLFDMMEANYKRSDYERFCFDLLSGRLKIANKKIVLFIENFGEFLNKLSDIEQHRLREVLMMNNQLWLVATSSVFLENEKKRTYGQTNVEQNFTYDKPFWEFFRIIPLEGLSKIEAQTLLRNLAKRYDKTDFLERILTNSPSRVEVLRRLSGGVVRTMVLLFEIFLDDENGSALSDLNMVLDRITPLYKHRTDDLSVQQQKIIDTIARHWDSISTKEIAERTRLESKLVSAQLKQLSQNHLIETIPTNTKNHLYQLSERFFNIWYLMRYGKRKDGSRVVWLVRFLEDWCDEGELKNRAFRHIEKIRNGEIEGDDALFMSEVYLKMNAIDWHTKVELHELLNQKFQNRDIQHLTKTDESLYARAENFKKEGKYEEALELYLKITAKNDLIYNCIGKSYSKINPIKALDYYKSLIEQKMYWAYFNIATEIILSKEQTLKYLNLWIEKDDNPSIATFFSFISDNFNEQEGDKLWEKIELKSNDKSIYQYIDASKRFSQFLLEKNNFEKSISKMRSCIDRINKLQNSNIFIIFLNDDYFLLLLQKKQYHATYQLFNDYPDLLKERFKPIWYALMVLMKDEFPDEHLRMPAELRETVQEIVQKVLN